MVADRLWVRVGAKGYPKPLLFCLACVVSEIASVVFETGQYVSLRFVCLLADRHSI